MATLNVDKREKELLDQISKLKVEIDAESNVTSQYEMGASGTYAADSDPEANDQLRRALAEQAYAQSQAGPSNMAAQLAMVHDPNFAGVFKDATMGRVNAARQYFGDLGKIQRESQSRRAARAKSMKRSPAKLKGLTTRMTDLQRALTGIRDLPVETEAKALIRRTPTFVYDSAGAERADLDRDIQRTNKDIAGLSARLEPTLKERLIQGAAPGSLMAEATAEDRAVLTQIGKMREMTDQWDAARRVVGSKPKKDTYNQWSKDYFKSQSESKGTPLKAGTERTRAGENTRNQLGRRGPGRQ